MGCAGEDRRSKQFVVVFVHKEFDIDRDIEIERAHRSLPWRIANARVHAAGPDQCMSNFCTLPIESMCFESTERWQEDF